MAQKNWEISLYRTFHRKLECTINGVQAALKEQRELTSTGDALVHISPYKGTELTTYLSCEIKYFPSFDVMCQVDESKIFLSNTAYATARVQLKPTTIQSVTIRKLNGEEEQLQITGFIFMASSVIFCIELTNIDHYCSENDEVTILIDFDLHAYQYVEKTTLQDLCFACMSLNLTKKNVFETLAYAELYIMKNLVDQCIEMIIRHFKELEPTENYIKLKDDFKLKIRFAAENSIWHEELVLEDDSDNEEENEIEQENDEEEEVDSD